MMAAALSALLGLVCQLEPVQPREPQVSPDADERHELKAAKTWAGVLPDETLRKAAPAGGVIQTQAALEELWTAWRAGEETPKIDFKKHIVLVGTADGPNRMFAGLTNDLAGNLKVMHGSTRMAGPGFGYVISLVPREGVTTINGKPLAEPGPPRGEGAPNESRRRPRRERPEGEFVAVTIQGKLETGLAAIGGETTGTVIRANGMSFELEISNDRLAKRAERLNGQMVTARGSLTIREGVERGPRLIVAARSIAPAVPSRAAQSGEGQSAPKEPAPQEE